MSIQHKAFKKNNNRVRGYEFRKSSDIIDSDIRSPITIVVALVFARIQSGIIDASAIRIFSRL